MIWFQLYYCVKVCDGTVKITFFYVNKPSIVTSSGVIRFESYCHVKVCDGSIKITFTVISTPPIVIIFSVIRFKFYCHVIVFNGTVKIPLFCVNNAAIHIGFRKVRFQFFRFGIMLDCSFIFFRFLIYGCCFICSLVTGKTLIKVRVRIPVNVLISNKSVKVVINGFRGYAVILPQML